MNEPATPSTSKTKIVLLLGTLGAIAGAVAAVPITILGKWVAGAPPADLRNYVWNMCVLGVVGAIFSPLFTFSSLRRAPLWRAVGEPLAGAIVGGALSLAISPWAFLLLLPAGFGAAIWRLNRAYAGSSLDAGVDPYDAARTLPK